MQAPPEVTDVEQHSSKSASKPPVVRNPRACTVCRAAKMKCVGAEDGQQQCQRCRRTDVECVFEKHRRGRKPGSKLSEASKMLRRLEKGLNTAKLKQAGETSMSSVFPAADSHPPQAESQFGGILRPVDRYGASASGGRSLDGDDEKFPAKLIRRENSFFRTILNPEHKSPYHPAVTPQVPRSDSNSPQQLRPAPLPTGYRDPITAGLINEDKAKMLFDAIFLRLNPFINLFDPQLHSVNYVRSKCPLLFTTLIAAGCKFFEPSLYKDCLHLAHELAVHAFAEGWKRVEVVQAFACLTYWKEQDENRTWMYIGYACRMAVELGLNTFVAKPPMNETDFQLLERRNRERTYLVLFVHDRSLSMQTGRLWMLPEDDFIRHADTWHERGGSPIRCEDVVVAAFIQLRRIAAETTDMLHTNRSIGDGGSGQVNIDMALKNANAKLSQWTTKWEHEMRRANGESFHFSFLNFFCLYSSLFLNSFGLQAEALPENRTNSHVRALSACFENALSVLQIASKDFSDLGVLRYGQETTTVMTAYSAIILLKLLRRSDTHPGLQSELPEGAAREIHTTIIRTAEAYNEAAHFSPTSSFAAYHARFLWHLIHMHRTRVEAVRDRPHHDPSVDLAVQRQQVSPSSQNDPRNTMTPYINYSVLNPQESYPFRESANGNGGVYGPASRGGVISNPNQTAPSINDYTTADFNYYRSMLFDLGFGGDEQPAVSTHDSLRNVTYGEGINTHYSQYPYGHAQPLGQNEFMGS
ncbi:hypothetical protein PAXRUDRAFT_832723 [Paxillus rubicundulus Ve08.2h10]|uniref:Zn(2)-C6 fungal-type domain-containing protein n=1 Tax=Paxillus rubicundulus Ve08.2h10 TaxID=930991 RepID=A0A0D0CFV3_9AGAM|nr:hypothetical protein PAXRUDRAFT_832723 [Paxillus rubicundulus Ve08.2h10]